MCTTWAAGSPELDQTAAPFPARDTQFWVNNYGFWDDPEDDERRIAFVRGLSDDLHPYLTGGHYVNSRGRDWRTAGARPTRDVRSRGL